LNMRPFARSLGRIGTESAFEVLARCRELERGGKKVLHFEIGEPDFPSPPHVVEATKRALDQGFTHYTPPQGIFELQEAICEEIAKSRGFRPNPDQVLIGPGGKPIILYAILATIEEGDEVIVQEPAYPMYASIVNYVGAKAVPVRLKEENDFRMTAEDVEEKVTGKTKKDKVWAGGDIVTGEATVISAMGAGKRAGKDIHQWLIGPPKKWNPG